MREKEKNRNDEIISGISGKLAMYSQEIHIEPDYFERERKENEAAQGYQVDMPEDVSSDEERIIRRSDYLVSELEHKRGPRFKDDYVNQEDEVAVKEELMLVDFAKVRELEVEGKVVLNIFYSREKKKSYFSIKSKKTGKTIIFTGVNKKGDNIFTLTGLEDLALAETKTKAALKV